MGSEVGCDVTVGDGVVGVLVGSEVGDGVGQPVPIELSVVIFQPLETVLDRAATSVGRSAHRLFEWRAKLAITPVSAPSCVGMVDESKFEFSLKPLVRATRLPNSLSLPSCDGIDKVSLFELMNWL